MSDCCREVAFIYRLRLAVVEVAMIETEVGCCIEGAITLRMTAVERLLLYRDWG